MKTASLTIASRSDLGHKPIWRGVWPVGVEPQSQRPSRHRRACPRSLSGPPSSSSMNRGTMARSAGLSMLARMSLSQPSPSAPGRSARWQKIGASSPAAPPRWSACAWVRTIRLIPPRVRGCLANLLGVVDASGLVHDQAVVVVQEVDVGRLALVGGRLHPQHRDPLTGPFHDRPASPQARSHGGATDQVAVSVPAGGPVWGMVGGDDSAAV